MTAAAQPALSVFAAARRDDAVRARVAALGPEPSLDELAACATAAGFPCAAADIATAFRSDGRMRWVHHGGT